MSQRELDYFKDLLIEKADGILGVAGKSKDEMSQEDDTFPDPVDRAMSESSRNIELRKLDRERKLLRKIREAIKRIEDGTYGICEECGDKISDERLSVRPEATLCIKCKEEQEKLEKQFGG